MLSRIFRKNEVSKAEEPPAPPTRSERTKMFIEAYVVTANRREIEGIIVDLSETGACIRFVSNNGLLVGHVIKLVAPLKRIQRTCKIIWRDQNDVGVRFV